MEIVSSSGFIEVIMEIKVYRELLYNQHLDTNLFFLSDIKFTRCDNINCQFE